MWDGRGGNPAHVLGPHIWNAPAGCPVAATPSEQPPDFAARAKDPAFGGALPEGQLFDGVPLLHFDGYALDRDGAPTFRYHLQAGTDDRLDVQERIESLRNGAAAGVARRFALQVPAQAERLAAGRRVRRRAATARRQGGGRAAGPEVRDGGSRRRPARRLLLPQDGDHVVILKLTAAPDGTVWRVQKGGAGWQALVRVPPGAADGKPKVDLDVWMPYRNEPELIKELLSPRNAPVRCAARADVARDCIRTRAVSVRLRAASGRATSPGERRDQLTPLAGLSICGDRPSACVKCGSGYCVEHRGVETCPDEPFPPGEEGPRICWNCSLSGNAKGRAVLDHRHRRVFRRADIFSVAVGVSRPDSFAGRPRSCRDVCE